MNEELITKAKAAKSAEELLTIAKENNYPLTEERAKELFEQLHESGELSDEELDMVGGGCGGQEEEKVWTYHESTRLGCFDYECAPEYEEHNEREKLTEVCYYCRYQEAVSVMSYTDIHCRCKKGNTPMQRY